MDPHPHPHQTLDSTSTVDTSSAFRSVKEAIAVFGERILVSSPLPSTKPIKRENSWRFTSSPTTTKTTTTTTTKCEEDHKEDITSYNNYDHHHYQNNKDDYDDDSSNSSNKNNNNNGGLLETLRKLEAELEETKMELKLLKERESDTEVALATLNAELHKNMSKLAQAEAAAAGKAAAVKTVRFDERLNDYREVNDSKYDYGEIKVEEGVVKKKKKKETLAQILSIGGRFESYNNYLGNNEKMRERKVIKKKMKPIIPLVGDFFSKKNGSPSSHHNPLYASPSFYD